uniref:Uncharacterized protein AlNc14C37G3268 n=1 Tax=Albugo laibachii Nc14 TaxID=890382 RepID=F0W8Z8_9STRA|nr:conserved hypothetical protein [Albugo laibachii Nc14]|eukprot:CCA17609.1 conserved hypothetical protein [Albugo laibachii Nc14]
MEAVNKKADWETRHNESLRQISETLKVACNTSEMISLQSEQLDQTERDLDQAQSAVDTSKRIIRGMAWSGWLYNRFVDSGTRAVKIPETKIAMGFICPECKIEFASDLLLMTHYRSKHDSKSVVSSESNFQSEDGRKGTINQQVDGKRSRMETSLDDVNTAYLSALEPSLKELKQASLAMGYALDTQNKQLDRIDDKVDRANDEMRIVALQSKRLLGPKSGHPMYSFRCALQEFSTKSFMKDVRGEPLLSANVISEGCTYRAFSVDTENNVWGFQSELSGAFLGVNRFGYLKIKAPELKSYEQFIVNLDQPTTTLFCTASYMWTGGWISRREDKDGHGEFDERLGIVRGNSDNKCLAARFKVVLMDKLVQTPTSLPNHTQN